MEFRDSPEEAAFREEIRDFLKRELPDDELAELVRLHEEMELEVRPDLAPGVRVALQALQGKYRLGVISDTVFSPGRALRRILEEEGLLDLFEAFAFSDEVGGSKPDEKILSSLGIDVEKTGRIECFHGRG